MLLLASAGIGAADFGVITLAEGNLRLLRGAAVLQAAQGVRVEPGDILESDDRGIDILEFNDGLLLGLGPNSRLFLPEGGTRRKGADAGQAIVLLAGWLKAEAGKQAPAEGYRILTTTLGLATRDAKLLLHAAERASLFVESGGGRLLEPDAAGRAASGAMLRAGQFARRAATQRAALQERPSAEFLASMPRGFRDALPARPERLKADPLAPKALHDARYEDVKDWLMLPSAWRGELMRRYVVRLRDADFRKAVAANIARHPEWRRILFPPPPPEGDAAETRRN